MSSAPAHRLPGAPRRRRSPLEPPKSPPRPPEAPSTGTGRSLATTTKEQSCTTDQHVSVASERKPVIGHIEGGVAWVSPSSTVCFSSTPAPQVSPLQRCKTEPDTGAEVKEEFVANSPISNRGTTKPQKLPESSRVPFVRLERLRMPLVSGRLLVSQILAGERRHDGSHPNCERPPEGTVSLEPARSCTSQTHQRKIMIAIPVFLPFVSLHRVLQGKLAEGQTVKLGQQNPPRPWHNTSGVPQRPSRNPSGVPQRPSRNPSAPRTSSELKPDPVPPESESDLESKPDLKSEADLKTKPDLKSKADLESKPDLKSLKSKTDLESKPDLKSEPDLESMPNLKSLKSEPDLESKPDLKSEPDWKLKPKLKSEPNVDLEHHLEPESDLRVEPQPETDSQLESEQEQESKMFLGSGPHMECEPESLPESEPEADLEVDPVSEPKAISETYPESEPDPELQPDLEPESDQDPGPLVASVMMSHPCEHPDRPQEEEPREGAVQMENEDFCAVCLNGGDLLCCDHCPKVFHLSCHIPALLSFPAGDWLCSLCRDVLQPELEYDCENTRLCSGDPMQRGVSYGLSPCDLRRCEKLTLLVSCNVLSAPFHEPVSLLARHYYQIIKRPMDLSVIRSKLNKRHPLHYLTTEDYVADISLMFRNCATFNYPDSEVAQAGRSLEAFFQTKVREVFPSKTFYTASDGSSDSEDYRKFYRTWSSSKEDCYRKRKRQRSLNWPGHGL